MEEDTIIMMEGIEEVEIVVAAEAVEEEVEVEVDTEMKEETIMMVHQEDGMIIETTVVIMTVGKLRLGIIIRLNIRSKRKIGDLVEIQDGRPALIIIITVGVLRMLIIRMILLMLGEQIMLIIKLPPVGIIQMMIKRIQCQNKVGEYPITTTT